MRQRRAGAARSLAALHARRDAPGHDRPDAPRVADGFAIAPYEFHEECARLATGDRLDYRFEAQSAGRCSRSTTRTASRSSSPVSRDERDRIQRRVPSALAAAAIACAGRRGRAARSIDFRIRVLRAARRFDERRSSRAAVRPRRHAHRQLPGHRALHRAMRWSAWASALPTTRRCAAASDRRCASRSAGCSTPTTPRRSSRRSRSTGSATPTWDGARTSSTTASRMRCAALAAQSPLFLCTSKPEIYRPRIVTLFGSREHFAGVYGADLAGRLDDKVELLAHLAAREGLDPARAIMIGDRAARHARRAHERCARDRRAVGLRFARGACRRRRDVAARPAEIGARRRGGQGLSRPRAMQEAREHGDRDDRPGRRTACAGRSSGASSRERQHEHEVVRVRFERRA